jgi:hypothetical protein
MAAGDNEPGILQLIRLLLDQTSAEALEKAMQEALKKGSDPKTTKDNLGQVDKALKGLKGLALEVGAALGIAFGVKKIIDFGRESVKAALDSREVWAQLASAVKNVGVNYDSVSASIQKNAMQFLRAGIMGDEEFGSVLTRLVQMSGNYEKSLHNVSVVADVAAARHLDLEKAAQMVGMAMDGNATRLKQLGVDVPKGADAVQYLADKYKGAAEASDPLVRQQKALAETWDNLKEAVGEAILGVGGAHTAMDGLIPIIERVTTAIENNKDGLQDFGEVASWAVKGPIAGLIMAFEGYARIVSAVMTAKEALLEINEKLWNVFRSPEEKAAIAKRIADTAELARKTESAADAAKELREAIVGQGGGEKPKAGMPDLMKGPPGGAVHPATGGPGGGHEGRTGAGDTKTQDEYFDEVFRKDQAVFQRQIQAAKVLADNDETRAEGIERLAKAQSNLNDYMDEMYLTWEQRAEIMKEQQEIQDGLVESLKKMADEYGVTTKALDEFAKGHVRAGIEAIKGEAKSRAAWNVATAIEELARSLAAGATGNAAGAAAHLTAMKSHLASAARWAALAAGAGLAGSAGGGGGGGAGGGGGGGAGPTGLGNDAAQAAKGPGTLVEIYVDGFDPKSTKQQDWLAQANEDIRQRYGQDSSITVSSGSVPRR